jgi:hypothetical protein
MKIKIYYYSFNTVCALISSCAEDDFETVGVCPVVESTVPNNLASKRTF